MNDTERKAKMLQKATWCLEDVAGAIGMTHSELYGWVEGPTSATTISQVTDALDHLSEALKDLSDELKRRQFDA